MQKDAVSGRLLLPNLYNARDLGNMPYGDGRKTASCRLIRSDALDHLTSSEAEELSRYPVKAVIDLRSEAEAEAHPDTIRDDPRFTYYNIPRVCPRTGCATHGRHTGARPPHLPKRCFQYGETSGSF